MPLPPVSFPTLGWQVIDWVEQYLCHGPGDVQGELWLPPEKAVATPGLAMDDDEVLFICWAYRVHPQGHPLAGRRLVHRGVRSRPKGRRKSEIAGTLMCAEALGPVRCDGFDANGDPVGVPVTYPYIRCLATEEEQSGNTYDNVTYMLTEGEAANVYALDIGRSAETSTRIIVREPGGGEIVPSTSGSASKDGGKETAATADETHLYVSPNLRGMYRTVARNTGKRKIAEPWILDTTTAWQPGERSIAEQAADRYMHLPVEQAVTKHGVLFDHHQGDEPVRFNDDRSLAKAIRSAYGPAAEWMDCDRVVKIVRDAEDPEEEGYRYYLNIPRKTKEQWLAPDEIQAVLTDEVIVRGTLVGGGFDGSETDDHTALWACTEDGLLQPIGIWAPAQEDADWRLNVDDTVRWAFEHLEIVRFNGDPPWWQLEMGQWAKDFNDEKRPGTLPVVEWWTNRDSHMGIACGATRSGIRQKQLRINPTPLRTEPIIRDGKPLAVWHFENARTRKVRVKLEDRAEEAHVVRKERPGSPLKIDSVPAAVLAVRARDDGVKAGEFVGKPNYRRASW